MNFYFCCPEKCIQYTINSYWPRLSWITAYLKVKIWSLLKHENLTTCNKILWKRGKNCSYGAIYPLFHNFSIYSGTSVIWTAIFQNYRIFRRRLMVRTFFHYNLLQKYHQFFEFQFFENINFSNRFISPNQRNSYKNLLLNSKSQTASQGPCYRSPKSPFAQKNKIWHKK